MCYIYKEAAVVFVSKAEINDFRKNLLDQFWYTYFFPLLAHCEMNFFKRISCSIKLVFKCWGSYQQTSGDFLGFFLEISFFGIPIMFWFSVGNSTNEKKKTFYQKQIWVWSLVFLGKPKKYCSGSSGSFYFRSSGIEIS